MDTTSNPSTNVRQTKFQAYVTDVRVRLKLEGHKSIDQVETNETGLGGQNSIDQVQTNETGLGCQKSINQVEH